MNKNLKIGIISVVSVVVGLLVLLALTYLFVLPLVVSNQNFLEFVQKTIKQTCGAELIIQKPVLKTYPKMYFTFVSDNLLLTKDGKTLLSVDNLDCDISFNNILKKQIILNKLGADDVYVDVNQLQTLTKAEGGESKPFDYKIRWFNYSFDYSHNNTTYYNCNN